MSGVESRHARRTALSVAGERGWLPYEAQASMLLQKLVERGLKLNATSWSNAQPHFATS